MRPSRLTARLILALLLLGGLWLSVTTATAADPLHILCIGDSITQGGKRDRDEWTYRLPLQEMLREAGVAFDFLGTRTKGLNEDVKWPAVKGEAFDPHHEGYYGAKTAAVRDKLRDALPKLAAPDIALIHLGTNDQSASDYTAAVVAPLEDMIGQLRAKNPKVMVLVGHLCFNGGAAVKIRPLVEDMAQRLNTPESPVVTVVHYKGWKENPPMEGTDTFDWAHPNPQGQRKMAENWMKAMQPRLPVAHP